LMPASGVSASSVLYTYMDKFDERGHQALVELYPFFKLQWGETDDDVLRWRAKIVQDLMKNCGYCLKKLSVDLRCSKCKRVAYCSVDCQGKDWVKVHKSVCKKIRSR
jgi:hypothetical protein